MSLKIIVACSILLISASCKNQENDRERKSSGKALIKSKVKGDTVKNILKVTYPKPNDVIISPQKLEGEARGFWFFEADAPVELLDANYTTITETYIAATGEWMTEAWVPFEGELSFPKPATENGFLIFHRANPSGLEEHAVSDTIKVRF